MNPPLWYSGKFSKAPFVRFCHYTPNIRINYDKVLEFYWNRSTIFDIICTRVLKNILQDPAKPCGTAHNAAFPDSKPPQLLRIYYQEMSIDTTKHREMRTYGFAPPFELPLKITYRPTG